jgi:hypothetical protein
MTDFQQAKRKRRTCKYFEDCSAPMCPLDTGASTKVWFAGEPVCGLHDVPEWVKRQRKIAKTGVNEKAGYFTLPMLAHHCIIGKKICGIDPDGTDVERKNSVKDWLNTHPPIKKKTDGEKQKLAARMRFLRAIRLELVDENS